MLEMPQRRLPAGGVLCSRDNMHIDGDYSRGGCINTEHRTDGKNNGARFTFYRNIYQYIYIYICF